MTLLPMENRATILRELKCFGKEKPNNIPQILEEYIKNLACNGQTMIPWIFIKPLILHKFNKVVDAFINEGKLLDNAQSPNITELRQRVYDTLKSHEGIPFTIQRICELLESPLRYYNRVDKFLRGFEKVSLVVSTIDPQGNKIIYEDPRYRSQAGMDGCNSSVLEGISPPVSPSMNASHKLPVSKSSDDEEMTEDENEDEFENRAESSSSTSPSDLIPIPQNTVSKDSIASSSWPFAHCPESNENDLTSVVEPVLSPSPKKPRVTLPDPCSKLETLPDTTFPSGSTVELRQPETIDASVPPIIQVLRPIGQLEAFVQNMSADIPSLSSCVLSSSSSSHGPVNDHVLSDVIDNTPEKSTSITPIGGKRRSDSPSDHALTIDSNGSESVPESDHSHLEQSPAKRRRLSESLINSPCAESPSTLPETVAATLNDSPPIIVCAPDGHNRNIENGEVDQIVKEDLQGDDESASNELHQTVDTETSSEILEPVQTREPSDDANTEAENEQNPEIMDTHV